MATEYPHDVIRAIRPQQAMPATKRPRGRPRGKVTPDKIAHTIRFDAATYAYIASLAQAAGYPINQVINKILEAYIAADWAMVDLGIMPGIENRETVVIKWPQRPEAGE